MNNYATIINIQEGVYKNVNPVFIVDVRYPDTSLSGAYLFQTFDEVIEFVKSVQDNRKNNAKAKEEVKDAS